MAEWWEEYEAPDGTPKGGSRLRNYTPKKAPLREIEDAPRARGIKERFTDSMEEAALHSTIGAEGVKRQLLKRRGYTDAQINVMERRRLQKLERKRHLDPDGGTLQAKALGQIVDFAGALVGGVDPTYLMGPGKTALQRIGAQAGINAGVDSFSQGVELERGVRDKYDPLQTGLNAAVGAAFQGVGEGVRKANTGRRISRGSKYPQYASLTDTILRLEGGGTLANPKTSPKGAKGPMQVMPATARDPGFGIRPWNGKTEADRARVGRQYAAVLNDKYKGDTAKVLAAYNAGPGRVDGLIKRYGNDWFDHLPAETKNYVGKGLGEMGDRAIAERPPVPPMEPRDMATVMGDKDAALGEIPHWEDLPVQDRVNEIVDHFQKGGQWLDLMKDVRDFGDAHEIEILAEFDRRSALPHEHDKDGNYIAKSADIEQFPANRIVNPDTAGPSSDVPFRMTEDSGIPNIDDLRAERYNRDMKANNEKLAAQETEYLDNLWERGAKMKDVISEHMQGRNILSPGELRDAIAEWEDLARNMGRSKLPPLGKDIVDDVLDSFKVLVDELDRGEQRGVRPGGPVDNTGYEKFTPYMEPKAPANDPKGKGPIDTIKDIIDDDEGVFRPFGRKGYRDARNDGPEGPDQPTDKAPEPDEVVKKFTEVMKTARKSSREQEKLYHEERVKRVGRLADIQEMGGSLEEQKGAMAGAMPKVDYESIAKDFTPEEIQALNQKILDNNYLLPLQKFRAQLALAKLLGADGARVPPPNELQLLQEVFPREFIKAVLSNREMSAKIWDAVGNAASLPKSMMASLDLSAPFRQGIFMLGRKEFWKAWPTMFKVFGSQRTFDALRAEINNRPTSDLMHRAKLDITDIGEFSNKREDAFNSPLAERIPILGRGIKASNRAYTGFLIKLRADVFDSLINAGHDQGKPWDDKALRSLGGYINAATGRGDLGKLEAWAPALNAMFFSPRLISSRLKLMNPVNYATMDPFVRKEALKDLIKFSATAATLLGLAKLAGAEVETDSRSSDFAKIKVGNSRYDILGGFQQYYVLGSRLFEGETKTAKGAIRDLTSGKYGQKTRRDVFEAFIRNKFSPIASYFSNSLEGKDPVGEEFHPVKDAYKSFLPMVSGDLYDIVEEGGPEATLTGLPSIFGVGIQTYKIPPPKASKKAEWWEEFESPSQQEDQEWSQPSKEW